MADGVSAPLLRVEDLRVRFSTEDGVVNAVRDVSFVLHRGEVLALVGESGSGKTATCLAVMGLLDAATAVVSGQVLFEDQNLLDAPPDVLRSVRTKRIAMVFQDPLSSLHPYLRVGAQVAEAIVLHEHISKRAALQRAVELLELVGIPDAEERARAFPHQLSGGMRQRAMIAMAVSCNPDILIADEPTTALDVTVQAQILELLKRLQRELHSALILVTHDLCVVAGIADTVHVMYAGRIVEGAPKQRLFSQPQHPYTWGLLASVPRIGAARRRRLDAIPGRPPSLLSLPAGCAFHPRCPHASDVCRQVVPELVDAGEAHAVACHLAVEQRVAMWEQVRPR